jgi:uncharacterized membrane protein YhiD involved in acid resistance
MTQYLLNLLEQGKTLTVKEILSNLAVATAIGVVIFISYMYTHAGTIYSRKFNVSLLMLTLLTTMVMTVIGNNIALSLGMVGALSIVRYRTAIKDSRDTAYIFWAIITGICCGAGDYLIGSLGTAVVFIILLIFGKIKNDNRMLVIIRGSRSSERQIEAIIFNYYSAKANLRVKNTTELTVEYIYEVTKKDMHKASVNEKSITDKLYELQNIEYVNIVQQNDEVNN